MKYVLVTWPESQMLMEQDWFDACILMNDEDHLESIGPCAYFVPDYLYMLFLSEVENEMH